ncbi:unnamed protein product [Caenorhabditis nigoni]
MCSNVTSYFDSDEFYLTALHVLTIIEVPVHLFGAFIVIFKTPKKMASIKNSLLSLHCLSAFVDFYLSFLTSPVLTIPSSAGYPLGVSKWLAIPTSIQVYLAFSLVSAVSVSIVLLFEGRYYVLANGTSSNRNWKRKLHLIFLYCLSLLFFLPSFLNIPDQKEGQLSLLRKIPCFPPDLLNRPGFFVLAVDATVCAICVGSMTSFLVVHGLFYVVSIVWQLSGSSSKSRNSHKLQKQLMITLGIQVVIPISVFFVPTFILIFLVWNNQFNPTATNMSVVMASAHGAMSTITMLIVHRPYREATLDTFYWITLKERKPTKSRIMITVVGQNGQIAKRVAS